MNKITGANVLSEDKLFATLDPTTRKSELPSGEEALFTDTVGFIRKLPHHLVKAFKSTLDEVRFADILLIVADASDPEVFEQLAVTEGVIEELGAGGKPTVYVFNKSELVSSDDFVSSYKPSVAVSAKLGNGIDKLLSLIEEIIRQNKKEVKLLIPYEKQSVVSGLYNDYAVNNVEYANEGVIVDVVLDERGLGLYKKYISE